jgi:hypothetical protein
MKALISPNELFTWNWITSWTWDSTPTLINSSVKGWVPNTDSILNCQRVVQVEPDNKIFPVASPLYWVDCPDNCVADWWYYKDGQVQAKPQDVPKPEGE